MLLCVIGAGNIFSQCVDIPNNPKSMGANHDRQVAQAELKEWEKAEPVISFATAPKPSPSPGGAKQPDPPAFDKAKYEQWLALYEKAHDASPYITFGIPETTSIKLVVDNDVDSGYLRGEDYVQFSVAQDVYVNDLDHGERCLVIPQGTKVYGTVDKGKNRKYFRIGGKAVLIVYITRIRLDSGEEIPITFAEPEDVTHSDDRATKMVEPCFHDESKKCIHGRLAKTMLQGNVFSGGAQGLAVVEDQKTATHLALLSLVQDLASSSGITDIINQQNSALKSKITIFEAHPDCNFIPITPDPNLRCYVTRNWSIKLAPSQASPKDATQTATKSN
jgi:hypothetical protein